MQDIKPLSFLPEKAPEATGIVLPLARYTTMTEALRASAAYKNVKVDNENKYTRKIRLLIEGES